VSHPPPLHLRTAPITSKPKSISGFVAFYQIGSSLRKRKSGVNAFLLMLCVPAEDDRAAGDRLLRPAFGMYRIEWPTDDSVEFHLSHGDWIGLLRRSGFEIEDLIEIRPGADAKTTYPFVTLEWARQWPSEEVWKVRKR
jgi:hypothetical protein